MRGDKNGESIPLIQHGSASSAPTPLPKLKLMLMCLVQFCEGFNANSLFAYLAYMVLSFGITHKKSDVGFYSGFIASSFFACQFISSFIWGRFSDKHGRRPVLLIGLTGSVVSSIMFGLSKNIALAIVSRCINGLLNGNLPVARTYLGEATDKSNQALSFSIFGTAWGAGVVLGPLVGGLLAQPTTSYHWPKWLAWGVLDDFPFLLPNLFTATFTLITLVLCFFYMEESVHKNGKKAPRSFKQAFLDVFGDKTAILCCCLFAVLCFGYIIYVEVFPLWAITEPEDGGLHFNTNKIGIMLGIAGGYAVTMQLFTFRPMTKFLSFRQIFVGCILMISLVLVLFIETGALVPGKHASVKKRAAFWIPVGICMSIIQQCMQTAFSACNVMMNNSVPFTKMGAMNGVAMSLAALLRAVGPTLGANIFALTTGKEHSFLISFRTAFYLVVVTYVCLALLCLKLPARVNAPYVDPNATTTATTAAPINIASE